MNIAFDSHKRYTLCSVADDCGRIIDEMRIEHRRGEISKYLSRFPAGEAVAVETIGNWYWIVDEIEAAGMEARLVHARKAKMMMGCVNKTDRLDVRGLNRLQQVGTLPTVWIPPGVLRDQRDLTRTRMYLVAQRTRLKNRIHATLAKYGLSLPGVSDIFGRCSREQLLKQIANLPQQSTYTTKIQLEHTDRLERSIMELNSVIEDVIGSSREIALLRSAPGIGKIVSIVVCLEVGAIDRFPSAAALASYAGTVPRVHASGGHVRYGQLRSDVNRYLKWAYAEAANSIVINQRVYPDRHVTQLYRKVQSRRGHQKAIGAVARHLAEATYWMLTKKEMYKDPSLKQSLPTRV